MTNRLSSRPVVGLACLCLAALALPLRAQETDPHQPPEKSLWVDGQAVVGSVRVDPATRSVIMPGWVNQADGAIELFACGPGGKTHESLLVLDVNPLDLQMGLLLLGLKPGTPPTNLGVGRPSGPPLDIWVEWAESGVQKKVRAESLVYDVQAGRVLPKTRWVFTGSVIEDGEFKALAEESLVVTYWDPWAIVVLPLDCGTNDEILVVNKDAVPKVKTAVTVRMTARKPWWKIW